MDVPMVVSSSAFQIGSLGHISFNGVDEELVLSSVRLGNFAMQNMLQPHEMGSIASFSHRQHALP